MAQTKAQLIDGKGTSTFTSPLQIAGSTSGTVTLQPNAVAGTPTLTLPDTTGTLDRLNRAGNILQVVNASYNTVTTSSSSTFADTGLTATITPTSSSSKILVLVNQTGCAKYTNDTFLLLRLIRGSTLIATIEGAGGATISTAANYFGSCSICYLDSPATTSATTYKTTFASNNNNATVSVQSFSSNSTITLLEVAA